jgi:signal transduction histidine kinase
MKEIDHNYYRLKFIFLCAIGLLVILSIIAFLKTNQMIEDSNMVSHTEKVKYDLNKLFSIILNIESSQRGYVLTRDNSFLPPVTNASKTIDLQLENIERLIRENPRQQLNFKILKATIYRRIDYLNTIVSDSKSSSLNSQRFLIGKGLMNEVVAQINLMVREEDRLLGIRTKTMTQSSNLSPIYSIILIISAIFILIMSYLRIIQELNISKNLKLNIEQSKNELEKSYDLLLIKTEQEEKRAEELVIANKEMAFQNKEKEKRAAELIIANKELAFQLGEKEKRASELIELNKELESFNYISSHDLQEPLRHIQSFASRIIVDEKENFSEKGKVYFEKIVSAANRMQCLLTDLLTYSRTATDDRLFETIDLNTMVNEIKIEFKETIVEKHAIIEVKDLCEVHVIQFQFHQLMYNLIGNALKFSKTDTPPHIKISSRIVVQSEVENVSLLPMINYCHITIEDNGIGFEPQYENKIFELFQRLHDKQKIAGTGIGLAIVKKIVENHKGFIKATGAINLGARFDVYIPLV